MSTSAVSQALKVISQDLLSPRPTRKVTPTLPLSALDDGEHIRISVANTLNVRRKAYRLLYQEYIAKGFATPEPSHMWYSLFDAHPETITFVARENGLMVGALTVVFDSVAGLPSDEIYRGELDQLRHNGRRLSEITSLGVRKTAQKAQAVLIKLFEAAYVAASEIRASTDFVVAVNPRHAGFYKRKMLFNQVGYQKRYEKVGGALAVLLQLDLNVAAEINAGTNVNVPGVSRSFYAKFQNHKQRARLAEIYQGQVRPISNDEMHYFFIEQKDLMNMAPKGQIEYLKCAYRGYACLGGKTLPTSRKNRRLAPGLAVA